MLRLALFLLLATAQAQDAETDGEDTDWTDGSSASELAGDEGGPGCDMVGGAGIGLAVVASLLAATRSRAT